MRNRQGSPKAERALMYEGFESWAVNGVCRRCQWWSAWEGQCVRSEDDPVPEDCPELDEGDEEAEKEADDWE